VLVSGIKLNEGGASFKDSTFSDSAKLRLEQHFSRLNAGFLEARSDAQRPVPLLLFMVDDHLFVHHAILDAGH
jgi:hypothetical protein